MFFFFFSSVYVFTRFQTILTQINHAIGAEGFVSMECKTVFSNYWNLIWENLVSGVSSFSTSRCFVPFADSIWSFSGLCCSDPSKMPLGVCPISFLEDLTLGQKRGPEQHSS